MKASDPFTTERLLCSPAAFGLETATPTQRAICRVADGLPLGDLACDPDVIDAIGDVSHMPLGAHPLEVYLLSGVRVAKSLMAATLATRSAMSCDVSGTRDGEPIRVSIVSLTRDLADVVVQHLIGTFTAKPMLRSLLVGEPNADGLKVRHPSGREIEIRVVAGSKAGASVVARWSAGVIYDEAPRMNGEDDGVVNFSESRRAALGRLLPGAQLIAIGSPWAPRGPMFEAVQAHWKKPTRDLVVIKAPATAMNPTWWMPARIAQVQALPDGDLIYKTDVLAEFADPSSSLFASVEILRGTRKGPVTLNYVAGGAYSAAMDPATRGNAWTLVVVAHEDRGDGATEFVRVVCARQWQGSRTTPLQPDAVLAEVAGILCDYDLHEVWTDQLASDFVVDIAGRHGLEVQVQATTPANKVEMFESLRARISDGGVELPDDPAMRADLLAIRKIVTRNGVAIDLPRTADGRHCDYAPALALAVSKGGEGTPLWVRAMMAWKARENGEAPPAREAPRAANYFVDPATDRTFGQREKYVPPVVATTDYIRAIVTVVGNPPHYPRDYVATWVRAEHTRFTPNCTKEFREEVERQRSRGTL